MDIYPAASLQVASVRSIKLGDLRERLGANAGHVTNCRLTLSTAMKVLAHAMTGVKKQGAQPAGEKMGLLAGHVQLDDEMKTVVVTEVRTPGLVLLRPPRCALIPLALPLTPHPPPPPPPPPPRTQAFPLPATNSADGEIEVDEKIMNYFSSLMDQVAKELPGDQIIGWYLSHPFNVGPYPHTYMSARALSMQRIWQKIEDAHGNPFVHLSVDPLRTLSSETPEMMVFRARPEGSSATAKLPDGTAASDSADRVARWGSEYTKYYALNHTIEASPSTMRVMAQMQEGHLWSSALMSTPMLGAEAQAQLAQRIGLVADGLDVGGGSGGSGGNSSGRGGGRRGVVAEPQSATAAEKFSETATQLTAEVWTMQTAQVVKDAVFNAAK